MADYSYGSQFMKDLDREIMELVLDGDDPKDPSKFDYLALKEFTYQFHNNPILRNRCLKRYGIKSPDEIDHFTDIPEIPSDAYKKWKIISFPEELLPLATHFTSSGSSSKRDEHGRPLAVGHFYIDPDAMKLFNAAILTTAEKYLFPEGKRKFLLISPHPQLAPTMPMLYDMELIRINFGAEGSAFFIGKEGLDARKLVGDLKVAERSGEPVVIGGASFANLLFMNECKEKRLSFNLPKGSVAADGGGYKGRSREMTKKEFITLSCEMFGISEDHVVNILGYSEHPSLLYDNVYSNAVLGRREPRYKPNLPWTRTLVVDPEKYPKETVFLKGGERGILRHFDLTDRGTVIAVQTDDEGELIGDGFEIWGRAKGAGPRGCSLAVEEMMETITW